MKTYPVLGFFSPLLLTATLGHSYQCYLTNKVKLQELMKFAQGYRHRWKEGKANDFLGNFSGKA